MIGKYLICKAVVLQHRGLGPDTERHQGSIPGLALIVNLEGLPTLCLLRPCVHCQVQTTVTFVALALPLSEGLALCLRITEACTFPESGSIEPQ